MCRQAERKIYLTRLYVSLYACDLSALRYSPCMCFNILFNASYLDCGLISALSSGVDKGGISSCRNWNACSDYGCPHELGSKLKADLLAPARCEFGPMEFSLRRMMIIPFGLTSPSGFRSWDLYQSRIISEARV